MACFEIMQKNLKSLIIGSKQQLPIRMLQLIQWRVKSPNAEQIQRCHITVTIAMNKPLSKKCIIKTISEYS